MLTRLAYNSQRLACHCLKVSITGVWHHTQTLLYHWATSPVLFLLFKTGSYYVYIAQADPELRQLWNFYPLALVLVVGIYRAMPPGLTQPTSNTYSKAYVGKYIRVLRHFLCVSLSFLLCPQGGMFFPSLWSVFLLQVIHQLSIYILPFIMPNFFSLSWHVSYPNLLYEVIRISIISSQLS